MQQPFRLIAFLFLKTAAVSAGAVVAPHRRGCGSLDTLDVLWPVLAGRSFLLL